MLLKFTCQVLLVAKHYQKSLQGIARRLIKAALREAAKKREMRYSDLKKIDRGVRRHFHDDITVVVLFMDPALIGKRLYGGPLLSLRGGGGTPTLAQKC
jgi:pyruvate dehydrogenase phosphatase